VAIKVLDVASYQATTFPLTGIDGVIVKATEGTSYVNPKHDAQVNFGRAHGLVIGHYHYAHGTEIHHQVDYFLGHAKPRSEDVLALDWEDSGVSNGEKDDFLAYLDSRVTNRVILYCNLDYWLRHDDTSRCGDGLWIADPNAPAGKPRIQHPHVLHQYTDTPMDTSLGIWENRAAFLAWARRGIAPAHPTLPTVSLSHAVAAFRTDPGARQGHQTYPADIKLIEHALVKVGMMHRSRYTEDGSAGTLSVAAYASWQKNYSRRHGLGWSGSDVNGIPGMTSLKALGAQSGLFKVVN
jgi:hypothetical protein